MSWVLTHGDRLYMHGAGTGGLELAQHAIPAKKKLHQLTGARDLVGLLLESRLRVMIRFIGAQFEHVPQHPHTELCAYEVRLIP